MQEVLLVIHLMLAVAIVALVLMQRSEGGALGIGGGNTGLMSGRAAGNLLTRATAIAAAAFFLTSLGLTILAGGHSRPSSVLEQLQRTAPADSSNQAPQPTGPQVPMPR